jgi:flagellar L-ring protein FlgH
MIQIRPFLSALILSVGLSGCNALDRVSSIGKQPELSPIQNPTADPNYRPVQMPMPTALQPGNRNANSLWQSGSRAFLRDQRAGRVGDILTVVITIDDTASLTNTSKRSRDTSEKADATSLLGFETKLGKVLPEAVNPTSLADIGSTSSNTGTGSVARKEQINLRVAAVITQVLPNGNLVLQGKQEVSVNYELRELTISGIIRPEDISSDNAVKYDQIAEARIAYGGKGQLSDVQQPRYGEQLYDILFPF